MLVYLDNIIYFISKNGFSVVVYGMSSSDVKLYKLIYGI